MVSEEGGWVGQRKEKQGQPHVPHSTAPSGGDRPASLCTLRASPALRLRGPRSETEHVLAQSNAGCAGQARSGRAPREAGAGLQEHEEREQCWQGCEAPRPPNKTTDHPAACAHVFSLPGSCTFTMGVGKRGPGKAPGSEPQRWLNQQPEADQKPGCTTQ